MNDAYQDSGVTLNVDVQGGVGEINLKVVWGRLEMESARGLRCRWIEREKKMKGVLERSGSRIHYWLTGPEEGRLVAFTPGATMDHRMFDPQVSAVVGAGYRALTWDPRGHGLSKPIGNGFSVGAASEDLLAILDRVGATEVVLVGQSLGGNVAEELVFRHQERVSALVVIGCTCNTMLPSKLGLLALKASPLAFRLWPYGDLKRRTATSVSARTDVQ